MQHFEAQLRAVTAAIADMVEELVPKTKPSPYMKRWWSTELTRSRAAARRIGRRAYAWRGDPTDKVHDEYKVARNQYVAAIKKSKQEHWEAFLEEVDMKTIWTAHKYASADTSDGGRARIPTLTAKREDGTRWVADTNEQKSTMLYNTFFPKTREGPEEIPGDYEYPEPAFDFVPVTDEQIRRAVEKLNPFKAPGANGIPNIVIKRCIDMLLPHLGPLFRATFELDTYPDEWRNSITKVLRNPGKADYTIPGAYRPIALLDTIGKVLSACVAEDLVKMTERYRLLPNNHYSCRPGGTTTDALHYIVSAAKDMWKRGRVMGLLFLDIKGAFPNTVTECLLHNMCKRKIPEQYILVIQQILTNRWTWLKFDDFTSAWLPIDNGIG